jgi:RNA polymerase sigma factor (sigma-70 family)
MVTTRNARVGPARAADATVSSFSAESPRIVGRDTNPTGDERTDDPLRAYFAAIRRVPLLTAEEELALFRDIETARRCVEAARRAGADDGEIDRHVRRGCELRDRAIVANLRLVLSTARRYRHAGLPLEDLVQEGNLGLMKAAERFDVARGFRFSTYATWWIRQAMTNAVATTGRTIRLPTHVIGILRRIGAARAALLAELGRLPTAAEIAERTGLTLPRVEELLLAADGPSALAARLADGVSLGDVLPDREATSPEGALLKADEQRALAAAIGTLDARERAVIELRFGLRSRPELTLQETGRELGITRKRVRQLEDRALRRLRLRTRRVRRRAAA